MKFFIGAQAQKYAEEVHSLLCEYSTADYTPMEIGHSATWGFDPDDLRRYADTDQMPIRVRGKLHPVSEKAAAIIASLSPILQDMAYHGIRYSAGRCADALSYILSGPRDR